MRRNTRAPYPFRDAGGHASPSPKPQSLTSWFLFGALSVGLGFLCLVLVMVGIMAYPRIKVTRLSPGTPQAAAPPATVTAGEEPGQTEVPMPAQTILVSADNRAISDEHGTRLTVPVGALEDGQQVQMVSAPLSQALVEQLSEAYSITSPAYQVSATGDQDGIGRARLELPAADPNSRVAALIDNRYLAVLEIPPQAGYFIVLAHLGAPNAPSQYPSSGVDALPVSYFTLTEIGQSQRPASPVAPRGLLAPLLEDPDGAACGSMRGSHCWRSASKSVYVVWGDDYPDSMKDSEYLRVIDTIHATELIMQTYQAFEFSAAAISPNNAVHLRITNTVAEPTYEPRNGVIYLPWDVVANANAPANQRTLAHELFHWIQDEEYRMILAYYSHAHSWWLETTAEYGTFLIDPANLELNLTEYGMNSTQQDMLGFQSRPLIWDSGEQARYIQAQLLYLSICGNQAACALSHENLVRAINAGSYPFDDGDVLARYEANVRDAGLYLLGSPPQQSRTDAKLSPSLIGGASYGDYVLIRSVQEKRDPQFRFDYGMTSSQFSRPGPDEMQVTARIQKGGVYPLRVGSGRPTGLPGYLRIEPGPAFWLKLDQRQPVFYPAGSELEIAPISDQLGYGVVRVVGIAPDADQTFRAKVGFIDLAGDWLAKHNNVKFTESDCPDGEVNVGEVEGALAEDQLLAILSGYGTYVPDPDTADGSHLIWEQQTPLEGVILESEVSLTPEAVVLKYRIELPQAQSSLRWLPLRAARETPATAAGHPLGLVTGGLLLGTMMSTAHKRRWASYLLALSVLGALLLTGCVGLGIYGTIEGTYTFAQVERIDPTQNPYGDSRYLWHVHEGTGQMEIDLTTETSVSDLEGNVTSTASRCQVTLQSKVEAFIGADGLAPLPDLGD